MLTISRSVLGGIKGGEVMQYFGVIAGSWLFTVGGLTALGEMPNLSAGNFWYGVGAAIVGGLMTWWGARKGNKKTADKAEETAERTDQQDRDIDFLFAEIRKSNTKRDHLQQQLDENLAVLAAAKRESAAARTESEAAKLEAGKLLRMVEESQRRVRDLEKLLGIVEHDSPSEGQDDQGDLN